LVGVIKSPKEQKRVANRSQNRSQEQINGKPKREYQY